jgi:hypothetical protein
VKQGFTPWVHKFIAGWLIVAVGGLGSLAYCDSFLPGHEHHAYHLSVLKEPQAAPNRAEPSPAAQAQRHVGSRPAGRFMPGLALMIADQGFPPGAEPFIQSSLHDGYLLSVAHAHMLQSLSLSRSLLRIVPRARAAWLPPPEKPPRLNFV